MTPMKRTKIVADPVEPTILITRWFDAPPNLVFEAASRPELIKRWWGIRAQQMIVCEVDHRVGGRWRFVLRSPDGREDGFRGVYKEIVPNLRLIQTCIYEPFPDLEAIETVNFIADNGGTRLEVFVRHTTMQGRDAHLGAAFEEMHTRLAELLVTLDDTARSSDRADARA